MLYSDVAKMEMFEDFEDSVFVPLDLDEEEFNYFRKWKISELLIAS